MTRKTKRDLRFDGISVELIDEVHSFLGRNASVYDRKAVLGLVQMVGHDTQHAGPLAHNHALVLGSLEAKETSLRELHRTRKHLNSNVFILKVGSDF